MIFLYGKTCSLFNKITFSRKKIFALFFFSYKFAAAPTLANDELAYFVCNSAEFIQPIYHYGLHTIYRILWMENAIYRLRVVLYICIWYSIRDMHVTFSVFTLYNLIGKATTWKYIFLLYEPIIYVWQCKVFLRCTQANGRGKSE